MTNESNITPHSIRTAEEAREKGKRGGIASGKARRERKLFRDIIVAALDEKVAKGSRVTKKEALVAKTLKGMFDDPDIRDLQVLQEIIGESAPKTFAGGIVFQVGDKADIDRIEAAKDLGV